MTGIILDQIDANTIITRLCGNRNSGMCCCPAHDDKSPSLHVGTGRNGKVVVRCHAGCSQEQVIAALKAKGLWSGGSPKKPFVPDPTKSEAHEAYEKLTNAYAILRATLVANERPEKYLKGRGIDIVPENALLLPAAASRKLGLPFAYPAMVQPIANAGRLSGCLLTFLSRDGTKNLKKDGKNVRRIFGAKGYIRLGKGKADMPSALQDAARQ